MNMISNGPMVSVVIPAYNCQDTIRECILSMLSQDYPNCEIIVIDDGSTDASSKIIKLFEDHLVYVYSKNKGVSSARNIGMRMAKGEYITFCDSDDIVSVDYISSLVKTSKKNALAVGALTRWKEKLGLTDLKVISMDIDFRKESSKFAALLENGSIQGPCCKLFDLLMIKKNNLYFDEDMCFGEDFKFVLSYLKYVNRIIYNSKNIYYYRKNQHSITSGINEWRIISFLKASCFFTRFVYDEGLVGSDVDKFRVHQIVSDYFNLLLLASTRNMKEISGFRKLMRNDKNIVCAIQSRDKSRYPIFMECILLCDNPMIWKLAGWIRDMKKLFMIGVGRWAKGK